jgi:hypothetical protein
MYQLVNHWGPISRIVNGGFKRRKYTKFKLGFMEHFFILIIMQMVYCLVANYIDKGVSYEHKIIQVTMNHSVLRSWHNNQRGLNKQGI